MFAHFRMLANYASRVEKAKQSITDLSEKNKAFQLLFNNVVLELAEKNLFIDQNIRFLNISDSSRHLINELNETKAKLKSEISKNLSNIQSKVTYKYYLLIKLF
jgi:hypothetical protein